VAISNHRLLAFDGARVTFSYKDYARGNQRRTMTLAAPAFLRRFIQHILPRGFVRIRQFGFLANAHRAARVAFARTALASNSPPSGATVAQELRPRWTCPHCGGAMTIGPVLSAIQLAAATWRLDTS
jgi:hypothetical protein